MPLGCIYLLKIAAAQANMWRIGGDIGPNWGAVLRLLDTNTGTGAGPGSWNDMDSARSEQRSIW